MQRDKISIIIVNYNGHGLIEDCIASIERYLREDHELIVVDNGSSDESLGYLEDADERSSQLKLIQAGKNLGFSKASNMGASASSGDLLIFLNPDTEVLSSDISPIASLAKKKNTGVVGPKVLSGDKSLQYSSRSFPTLARQFYESFFLHKIFAKNSVFGSYFLTYKDHSKVSEVDWLSGAFLVMEKNKFLSLGGFDEDFFMYSEDTDLCYRSAKKGYKNYYCPDYMILHHDGSIAMRDPGRREADIWSSRRKYFKKHYGNGHAVCLSFLYFLAILNRLFIFVLPSVFSRSHRKRFAGYIRALRLYFGNTKGLTY